MMQHRELNPNKQRQSVNMQHGKFNIWHAVRIRNPKQ